MVMVESVSTRSTIGVCTDSNAQLPPELVARYRLAIVPATVRIGECEYLDGVDLDADELYRRFEGGRTPSVTITHPSPGQFALGYDELVEAGCTQILSVHAAASVCGAINDARLAARNAQVTVRLVDSGTSGFGVGCCVWAAAEAIAAGSELDAAAAIAETLAGFVGNVHIIDGLGVGSATGMVEVLTQCQGEKLGVVEVVDRVPTVADAVNSMSSFAVAVGDGLRVAIGVGDRGAFAVADALASAIGEAGNVIEVVRYRIGPTSGFSTIRPGTVACWVLPAL